MFNVGVIEAAATLDDSDYRNKLMRMPGLAKSTLSKVAGIAAGFLSFGAAAAGIKESVQAFIVQENAVKGVAAALKDSGMAEELEDYAGELQKVTTYGDEATLQAMSLGLNMGIAEGKIKDASKAAIGLATAYKMDLNTAMTMIAKANAGQTGALSRYGIELDKSKTKEEQFNELLGKGVDAFALAEEQARTTGGRLQQMGNAWGDLKEAVGEFIVNLFGVGDAAGGIMSVMQDLTVQIKENMGEWVFAIRSVYYDIEANVKKTWAVVEPAIMYLGRAFVAGCNDIVAIGQWAFENFGKVWENLPDVFIAMGKDILQFWRNIFDGLLHLAVNLGKAIWTAIKGGGAEGFKDMVDQLLEDAVRTVADAGGATEKALRDAGVTPFPEMESGDLAGMVDQYRQIGERFSQIDAQRAEKQAKLEADYARKLEESRKAGNGKTAQGAGGGPEATKKDNVAGSFSAAILSAMLGNGSPEKETAANTKELVRELKKTNAKITDGMEEVYT